MREPKIGTKRLSVFNQPEIYRACPECGLKFWCRMIRDENDVLIARYPTCKACGTKPGSTYTLKQGGTYIRLDKNDPFYPMSISLSLLGDGWVRTTRLSMAKSLGRCLDETEVVIRKSGDKNDDRPENFFVIYRSPRKSKDNEPEDFEDEDL